MKAQTIVPECAARLTMHAVESASSASLRVHRAGDGRVDERRCNNHLIESVVDKTGQLAGFPCPDSGGWEADSDRADAVGSMRPDRCAR